MVAKVNSGKNIRGVLNYNEHKVTEGVARCIMASRFGCDHTMLTFSDKLNRFQKLVSLNTKVKTNALHISLNFDISENLDDNTLRNIAATYMDKIGFAGQPYLVYRHLDAAHPHIHIVTTNIKHDRKRIDIHNIGKNQSERARNEIEALFSLVRASSKKQKDNTPYTTVERAHHGKSETKRSISNIVQWATRSYKFASLPEFNAILQQFNVMADAGADGSAMKKNNGLQYFLLDHNRKRLGVPIKASSIYGKPTLKNLQKQFELNEVLRKPFGDRLKKIIDKNLQKISTPDEFKIAMAKDDIVVLFRVNNENRIYGITFIDNKTKVVFNGRKLGKAYSANTIQRRLSNPKVHDSVNQTTSIAPDSKPRYEPPEDHLMHDLIIAHPDHTISPEAAMKLRKRRKKRRQSI